MLCAAGHIRAGTKCPARAGDDHRAHRVIRIRAEDRVLQFRAHRSSVRVQLVGTIERDDHKRAIEAACDVLVAHGPPRPFPPDGNHPRCILVVQSGFVHGWKIIGRVKLLRHGRSQQAR